MVSFLKRFFRRQQERMRYFPVRVRSRRCGEILETRIDLHNDLAVRYDERGQVTGYYVRKLLQGSGRNRCFDTVEVELFFDARRQLVDRQVHGGTFVDEEPKAETQN